MCRTSWPPSPRCRPRGLKFADVPSVLAAISKVPAARLKGRGVLSVLATISKVPAARPEVRGCAERPGRHLQ
eukprot:10360473-Heterocapsa_arctica.AAC.1